MITSEQIRAARALIRWEQKDLAEASKVSLPSVKRLESTPGPLPAQERTVDALRAALEAAGVEFTNGARPGVRLRQTTLPLRVTSSSELSVRLSYSIGGPPVVVHIERSAIDDALRLTNASKNFRWKIIEANLDRILPIVERRNQDGNYSVGSSGGSTFRQIVLRLDDLMRAKLRLPDET
jgi:hypothetical protein